jgi:predicted MPP superfamily phosphohydrolase
VGRQTTLDWYATQRPVKIIVEAFHLVVQGETGPPTVLDLGEQRGGYGERMSRFLAFITVVLTIAIGVHWYLWARLVRDPRLPAPWGAVVTCALALLAAGMPLAMALGRRSPAAGRALAWPAFIWMGLMFLLFVAFLGADVVRLAAWLAQRTGDAPVDAGRRVVAARLAAGAVTALSGSLAAVAIRAARGPIAVKRVEVALARLPRARDGFRIVQLTDVHVGSTIGRPFVEDVVRRANALSPDVVAITGDLVDGSVADLGAAVAPLASLRARHGVFFVTGNHEYFSGAEPWLAELARLGVRVLRNERVSIGDGADGFDLAGVEDHSAERFGGAPHEEAVARALGGRDPAREVVLLAHQPRSFTDAARFGVGLQLSGHTHGGQVWPFGLLVRLSQPFLAGLHRRGDSQIYVSRGTGYWGPPMRLGAPAEITELLLRRA